MRIFTLISGLLRLLVLLLLSCSFYAAPTHHLTIGVQGNTPTLIVTSSEIGITPQTMGLTRKTNKMDHAVKNVKDLNKNKSNKSHAPFNEKKEKQMLVEKHSNKANKLIEKSIKNGKNLQLKKQQESMNVRHENIPTTTTASSVANTVKIKETNATPLTLNLENFTKPQVMAVDRFTLSTKTQEKVDKIPLNLATTTMSTNLRPEEIDNLTTTTINYRETLNKAFKPKALKQMVIPANGTQSKLVNKNDDDAADNDADAEVVINQTKLKSLQTMPAINVLKISNETITANDSSTQTPAVVVTTDNENLLFTTTTLTTTTSPFASAENEDSKGTLINRNQAVAEATTPAETLALSSSLTTAAKTMTMTMTTTENIVDEQNRHTVTETQTISHPTGIDKQQEIDEKESKESVLKAKTSVMPTEVQEIDEKQSKQKVSKAKTIVMPTEIQQIKPIAEVATEISASTSQEALTTQQTALDSSYVAGLTSSLTKDFKEPVVLTENTAQTTEIDSKASEYELSSNPSLSTTTVIPSESKETTEMATEYELSSHSTVSTATVTPSKTKETTEKATQYELPSISATTVTPSETKETTEKATQYDLSSIASHFTTTVTPSKSKEQTEKATEYELPSISSLSTTTVTPSKTNETTEKATQYEMPSISTLSTTTVTPSESKETMEKATEHELSSISSISTTTVIPSESLETTEKLLTLLDLEQAKPKILNNLQPASLLTSMETPYQYTHTSKPLANAELDATSPATTEKVLKLIDLEQHVLKTIDDLKQPSLLMAGQHDNGHDGLKNIKKKQLVDKHYVEALLHNKQDGHLKDVNDFNTQTTTTTAKPSVFMPIKHGYLGPILMEEKTFHVIHHTDKGEEGKRAHKTDIETELRERHFVELKVQADVAQALESSTITNPVAADISTEKSLPQEPEKQATTMKSSPKYVPTEESLSDIDNKATTSTTVTTSVDKIKTEPHDLFNQTEDTSLPTINNINALNIMSQKPATVLSTTVFQVMDTKATKMPMVQANTMFTSEAKETNSLQIPANNKQTESKISDIQIEVYDSTIDSIIGSTNFRDAEKNHHNHEASLGKTTKPPLASLQQERFTQYVIDRTETSTQEPINYSTIQVASGKPEPAAIEIHINVSESFGNDSEDLEFSYPQTEFNGNNENRVLTDESYDDSKVSDNIKLKIPSNGSNNNKDPGNDEILVVEIIDTDNITDNSLQGKAKAKDELFITDVKDHYTTPPPPPPPPPYQSHFDRDSDTIFYISNTEVKVGESLPSTNNLNKNSNEERKLKLESQFFPANYMASTQTNLNPAEEMQSAAMPHHLYEEDILLSSSRNQQDSLKIYRNRNEPSPPLDVTYVGESIIEVEQLPDSAITTTYAPDHGQQQKLQGATPQADVIIQPAILPEISIGVPVIGELPPQIELKEIDFMPNEAQLHRSGMYDDNSNDIDDSNNNNNNNNQHDIDSNSNPHVDESSIQYGGDLIDESADGGFDGVEGSYPFGNPAASKSYTSAYMAKLRKQQQQQQQQQPNHVADYAHLYVNYGVNNMRKDELSADIKDSAEILSVGIGGGVGSGGGSGVGASNEQNLTTFKDFLNKVSLSNSSTQAYINGNLTQSERMSNATAFSVMEDANDLEDKNTEDIINLISLAIGLFIVILPVVVTCSMFWALRYLYKKYHSNITDNGGYIEQTETKVPPNEDGMEKGEFVHEPSSTLPTHCSDKDAIEKYPDTSNKPSTTDDTSANSSVKFSIEKLCHLKTTTATITTTTTTTMTNVTATTGSVAKTSDSKRLSLDLNDPSSLCQCPILTPPPPPPLLLTSVTTVTEQIHSVHDDNDDNDVKMPGPNGSITKMTMENNLLTVETEERNDISRVARETKMDYNKDGVFVVEVARGIDSKTIPESPVTDGGEKMLSMFDTKQNNGGVSCYKMANEKNGVNNEKVQIHSPPPENTEEGPRSLHQIEEVDEPINSPHPNDIKDSELNAGAETLAYKCNTGLSQSDLSSTSSSDSNKDYCYGNQALYVVEQNVYSATTPTGNVVLKCDVKDIKDDDRNPGNDHYLKHSPDKKDEAKDNEHVVETMEKTKEGGSRTSSGESPAQKPNEKVMELPEEPVKEKEEVKLEEPIRLGEEKEISNEILAKTQIPVEIEVHACDDLVKEQEQEIKEVESLQEAVSNKQPVEEVLEPLASAKPVQIIPTSIETEKEHVNDDSCEEEEHLSGKDLPADDETHSGGEVRLNEASEDNIALRQLVPVVRIENVSSEESNAPAGAEVEETNSSEQLPASSQPETFSDRGECKDQTNVSEEVHYEETQQVGEESIEVKDDSVIPNDCEVILNGFDESNEAPLHANGVLNGEENQEIANTEDLEHEHMLTNGFKEEQDMVNGSMETKEINSLTLPNADTIAAKLESLQNGHCDAVTDAENGYDSLMSLPAPPPTTDELQLNSDLSDQQMDSLPPPPPPEIFSLKDMPPPSLTNGCNADSPQSEESTSFYNTLPPPPPTTLDVTATVPVNNTTPTANGRVHASPLTPPASPPAHFTNNLHVGLCNQPIAVDVNGS